MSLVVNTSENGETSADIHTFIENVAKSNGIQDFVYTVESLYGNFVANIYTVVINDVQKDPEKTVTVVFKTLINSIRQELFREIHKRECLAYQKLIPRYKETLNEKSKLYLPECKFSSYENNKEIIILEHLNEKLFEECRLNRYLMFDYDHFKIVFSELAKFHAASFVLKERESGLYKEVTTEFKDVIFQDEFLNKTKLRNYFIESFKHSVSEVKNAEARKKLQSIETKLIEIVKEFLKPTRYNVLCHGDLWMKNIMFTYEEENPIQVCFIDFQAMRYTNPVTDILHYLYMNTDAKFRADHFVDLSNIYFESMTVFLRLHDIHVEKVYPRDYFLKSLKDCLPFGLLIALIQLKSVTLTPENDAIDHGSKLTGHTDLETVPGENMLLVHRVNDLVDEFVDNGVLDKIVKMS